MPVAKEFLQAHIPEFLNGLLILLPVKKKLPGSVRLAATMMTDRAFEGICFVSSFDIPVFPSDEITYLLTTITVPLPY